MDIDLDGLEALDAIDRHGGFSGAARHLGRVPSAISYTVRQLETHLGVELFDRSGHRAVFTAAGRAILDEGRAVLARARRLQGLAAEFASGVEPRLSVVFDGIVPMAPVMRVLKALHDEGVSTRIRMRVEFLGGVQDRFEATDADLMVVKSWEPSQRLVARDLPPVEVVLVTHADHPLGAADGGTVTIDDLRSHLELTVHDSSRSSRVVDARVFGGSRVLFLADFASKLQAIEAGLGFGWMPLALVREPLAAGTLVEVPWDGGPRYTFHPALVHRADRPPGATGQRFIDLLEAELAGV